MKEIVEPAGVHDLATIPESPWAPTLSGAPP
jgi:hypothetical protein